MFIRAKHGIVKPKTIVSLTIVTTSVPTPNTEPTHYSEAVKHFMWQAAMVEEYQALVKQGSWSLVDL